jgi:hypothetical protein
MLKGKLNAFPEFKVCRLPTKLPDDGAGAAVDLVYCVGVACGDQVVPFSVLVNAVDVEVVPSVGRVVAAASLAGVER